MKPFMNYLKENEIVTQIFVEGMILVAWVMAIVKLVSSHFVISDWSCLLHSVGKTLYECESVTYMHL